MQFKRICIFKSKFNLSVSNLQYQIKWTFKEQLNIYCLTKLRMKLFWTFWNWKSNDFLHTSFNPASTQTKPPCEIEYTPVFAQDHSTVIYAKNFWFDEARQSLPGNKNYIAWDMICIAWKCDTTGNFILLSSTVHCIDDPETCPYLVIYSFVGWWFAFYW